SNDVKHTPVATAYLYLGNGGNVLLIDPSKLTDQTTAYLKEQGVTTAPYDSVKEFLASVPAERVLINPALTSATVRNILGQKVMTTGIHPAAFFKAAKNDVQLEGVRNAMVRDGVALIRSFMEIEKRVAEGVHTTEMDVAEILRRHRSASPLFFDESFGTIAGYEAHGAIVHYEADETSNSTLEPHGLLLVDSGAQYLDGTTDITRTVALGTPTAEEKFDFTLVMKGHIALAQAIFPDDTRGAQLDALARQFLWKHGMSYLHGTGHGVGHFLGVHEGPQSIRLNYVDAILRPGMITSNEPGLYRTGVHGIRCENLVLTVPKYDTEFGKFLCFEILTLFPFDSTLMDTDLLTEDEIAWYNHYQAVVREKLMPHLTDEAEKAWLASKTEPISK
ncbi:MAG: M24 family metallopeptidase, partial [Muribaculaceae bacterium]|nr:M24 family metallopeptidase [Muribaculaceae bacterium]